jgi:hypothetical protein
LRASADETLTTAISPAPGCAEMATGSRGRLRHRCIDNNFRCEAMLVGVGTCAYIRSPSHVVGQFQTGDRYPDQEKKVMSKQAPPDLGTFVDQHPTTTVADLLGIINDSATLEGGCNRDIVTAYLLRVADCEGVPESIRSLARQLYNEWDLEVVSASAVALLSLGNLLH